MTFIRTWVDSEDFPTLAYRGYRVWKKHEVFEFDGLLWKPLSVSPDEVYVIQTDRLITGVK